MKGLFATVALIIGVLLVIAVFMDSADAWRAPRHACAGVSVLPLDAVLT
jgi:hypothetical protein